MPKRTTKPTESKYPSVRRKCKYCHLTFSTAPTYNGSQQKFCNEKHRNAFFLEGQKPIDVILKRQDKRLRAIAREEIATALAPLQFRIGVMMEKLNLTVYPMVPDSTGRLKWKPQDQLNPARSAPDSAR